MAILKNKTQGNFVIISQNIMRDNNLNLTERGLLVTLLSLSDGWDLSIAGLATILPDGKEKIGNALNKLISYGYLTREQGRGERGKFGRNVIEVHETPVSDGVIEDTCDSPCPENPATDYPYTVLPCPENPAQVNNNDTSNKKASKKECVDTLSDSDYRNLVVEFGKEAVDYQLQRIRQHHYQGCANYHTVRQWCTERRERRVDKVKQKSTFNNFKERDYDMDELKKALGIKTHIS